MIRRDGRTFIWSRGEELITDRSPEIAAAAEFVPDGTVLDGEIMPWKDGQPLPFAQLQRRIGRKTLGAKILSEVPAVLVDEVTRLRAASARVARDATSLVTITLPEQIARPVRGEIVRRFGTLVHERSKIVAAGPIPNRCAGLQITRRRCTERSTIASPSG